MNDTSTFRRSLSGIYIFDILPHDKGKRFPTCIEDCTESTRLKWLNGLNPEALVRTGQVLNECFLKLWDMLSDREQSQILDANDGDKPSCDITSDKELCVSRVNHFCKLIRYIADTTGICAQTSEAATQIPLIEEDD